MALTICLTSIWLRWVTRILLFSMSKSEIKERAISCIIRNEKSLYFHCGCIFFCVEYWYNRERIFEYLPGSLLETWLCCTVGDSRFQKSKATHAFAGTGSSDLEVLVHGCMSTWLWVHYFMSTWLYKCMTVQLPECTCHYCSDLCSDIISMLLWPKIWWDRRWLVDILQRDQWAGAEVGVDANAGVNWTELHRFHCAILSTGISYKCRCCNESVWHVFACWTLFGNISLFYRFFHTLHLYMFLL